MSGIRICDICHAGYSGPDKKRVASRYSVRRYVEKRFISAGSIDLCDKCWDFICKPHMRPQRRPRTTKNQHSL